MANNQPASAVPICAQLASIEVVGELEKRNSNTRPDHFVIVSVDDKKLAKSETKFRVPSPQWEWQEKLHFWFQPSSAINIEIYRESRLLGTYVQVTNHLVGQYTGKVIELLENDANIDLKDKNGTGIAAHIQIKLSLVYEPDSEDNFKNLMKIIGADISRLHGTVGTSTLGTVLQLTKDIANVVGDAHPILKASSTVMFSVYTAVQQAELLDDTVRELAESLREVLGVAKEFPDLLLIEGTTNVTEEIGRTSLKVASLIHEYTRPSYTGRLFKSQLSDMNSRIAQCQKSFDDLKQKFDRRLGADTNRQGARTEGAVEEVKGNLKTIKDDQKAKEIRQWLSAPDSSMNYNEAREKHQGGTCSWFLGGARFHELQEKAGLLWIKGTAGCGKTILCSSIIERIAELQKTNPSVVYAYFFFDGRDSQKDLQLHDKLIRSLILQLSLQCDGTPDALVELYGHGHQQPSTKSLQDTLQYIIDGLPSTYVIIDSLDECVERKKTLQWIDQIISRKANNLHMVVASRSEEDISKVLQPLDLYCVDLVGEPENHDIAIYLEQQFALESKWDEITRETIKAKLEIGAQGMFRWVALQLTELKKYSNQHSVMKQLDSLPEGLYETYDRILLKIDDRTDTKIFLQWLSFSTRPMTLAEIAEAVVVDFNTENQPRYMPSRRYWDKRDVLEKCSGLITESEGKVKLAHFSIKEYLVSEHLRTGAASNFHLTPDLSHSLISQTCLAYLLQFDDPGAFNLLEHWNTIESFPLARYAAEHWIFHAKLCGIDKSEPSSILTLALALFATEGTSSTFINWVRIWDLDEHYSAYREIPRHRRTEESDIAAPLYYASLAGLQQVSRHLLKGLADVNKQGGQYRNALQAATSGGYEEIVKMLLDEGADINAQGGIYRNALWAASSKGYESIVKLLLENGAEVNTQGGIYRNALWAAIFQQHEAIVKLLLEKGADVGGDNGRIALQAAVDQRNKVIVKLLLENGVDVNAQGGKFGNALQVASFRGFDDIVKQLVENGADVNIQGGHYHNALQAAATWGNEAIVKRLLENGADVYVEGGIHQTALLIAASAGHKAIMTLLMEKMVDVDYFIQGGNSGYGNALQAASAVGHEAFVQLLLEKGADVNEWGGDYGNALRAAASNEREAIVKLLLKNGADVNAQRGIYRTALWAASSAGHETIVKLLLENGADVNVEGGIYHNALWAAIFHQHAAIVKLLLEKGADVAGDNGRIALLASITHGTESIVKLLLENGVDVNAQGGKYGSALQAASAGGFEAIVNLLLENGADVNMQGGHFGSALRAASSEGHGAIVKLLLEKGADDRAL